MIFKNKDIRIIKLNINKTVDVITHYLKDKNFSVESKKEISSNNFLIRATNKLKSPFKLFKTGIPQTLHCHISKENEIETKIEIKFNLFRKYRLLIYSMLTIFMVLSRICVEITMTFLNPFIFLVFGTSIFIFIICAVFLAGKVACCDYTNFIKYFYSRIKELTSLKEIVLQQAVSPEMFKLPLFFIFLVVLVFNNLIFNRLDGILTDYSTGITLLFFISLVLLVSALLGCIYIFRYESINRMNFAVLGICLTGAICCYSYIPLFHSEMRLSVFREIETKRLMPLEKYAEKLNQSNLNQAHNLKKGKELQKYVRNYRRRVLFLFSFIWISVLVLSTSIIFFFPFRKIIEEFNLYKTEDNRSIYYKSLQPLSSHSLLSFFILLIWGLISIGVSTGVFILLTIIGHLVFGNYYQGNEISISFIQDVNLIFGYLLGRFFTTSQIAMISKGAILCYCMPIIIIVVLIIEKNIQKTTKMLFVLWKTNRIYHAEKSMIKQRLEKICDFAKIKIPLIAIKECDIINANIRYSVVALFQNVVEVTTKAIRSLEPSELEALLAHEVGHLKNNTSIKFMILNFLSDWTLFGNGFLAIIQNSIKIENEADDFAGQWVEDGSEEKIGKRALITLLYKQEKSRMNSILNQIKFKSRDNNTLSYYDSDWPSPELRKDIDDYSQKKWIDKIRINIKAFYELYFSEKVLSYFHPTYEERKARLE